MRNRLTTLLGVAALLAAAAPAIHAQDCGGRIPLEAGVGTVAYDPARDRDKARLMTWEEFNNLKFPRTVRTIGDFPSHISPTRRFGSFEQQLFAIEGIINGADWIGFQRGGDFSGRVADPNGLREMHFGFPQMSCRYPSPNFARIKDFERTIEPWIDRTEFKGYRVRVIGYGFWEELIGANSSLSAAMHPVLDIIVMDQDGNELQPPFAPDPPEKQTIDLNVTWRTVNRTFHATDKDGIWLPSAFGLRNEAATPNMVIIDNRGNNPASKTSGFGWTLFFGAPQDEFLVPGVYRSPRSVRESDPTRPLLKVEGTICDANSTVSTFTVTRNDWDCFDRAPGLQTPHLVNFDATFIYQCANEKLPMTGQIHYSAPAQVPCNNLGSGGGGGGTGGGGGDTGGGTGGGGGDTGGGTGGDTPAPPTPPTPTPASTPVIVVPSSVQFSGVHLNNLQSASVSLTTAIPDGFNSDVALSAFSEPEGLEVSLTPSTIAAPGSGETVLHIAAGANTRPQDYRVLLMITGNGLTSFNSVKVSVTCDPPFILGIDQPRNVTINRGASATLEVKPSGSVPVTYQWFAGQSGNTSNPILSGGTGASFNTGALTSTTNYWVRATNPCGSVDSNTVTVTVQ